MIEQAHISFTELYHADEFQQASSFREQVCLTVNSMRTDHFNIPFSEIAIVFGVSKGTIV
jgi:hypothetical protein